MDHLFPGRPITEIPDPDPIFHSVFDLEQRYQVPGEWSLGSRTPYLNGGSDPHWRAIYDDKNRITLTVLFNHDTGDSWEWADDPTLSRKILRPRHPHRHQLHHLRDNPLTAGSAVVTTKGATLIGKRRNVSRGGLMKRYRLDPKKPRRLTPEEARRLDAMPIDYSDIPPLDDAFFAKAIQVWPPAKQQLTIRLDADVLAWLKANGRGYQTRINRILRAAMESRPRPPGDAEEEHSGPRQTGLAACQVWQTKSSAMKKLVFEELLSSVREAGATVSSGNITDAPRRVRRLPLANLFGFVGKSRQAPASVRTEAGHSFRTRCRTASAIHWL